MKKSEMLEFFGGVTNAAAALGVHYSTVSKWAEEIPGHRVVHIQLAMQAELDKRAKEAAKKSRRKSRDVQESVPCKAQ